MEYRVKIVAKRGKIEKTFHGDTKISELVEWRDSVINDPGEYYNMYFEPVKEVRDLSINGCIENVCDTCVHGSTGDCEGADVEFNGKNIIKCSDYRLEENTGWHTTKL